MEKQEKILDQTFTQSPYPMIDMEDAYAIIDKAASEFIRRTMIVNLEESFNYVLAEDVTSNVNIPPFRASIMDGYAFKRREYESETQFTLISERSLAGVKDKALNEIEISTCSVMYVTTGAPVHNHFDIVIPIEHVIKSTEGIDEEEVKNKLIQVNKSDGGAILFLRQEVTNNWIREIGCDVNIGQIVLTDGWYIGCAEIGILASIGKAEGIKVYQKPVIGLAASGNEIVNWEEKEVNDGDGKIRDSNTPMLISIFKSHRFENIKSIGIISDDYDSIDDMFNKLTGDCDLVITTGGVSMGAKDLIKPYLAKNGEVLFGRLNMKPGKPTTFGKLNSKLIFSLPGNPVSCFVSAQVLIIRALKIMSGHKDYEPSIVNVDISKPIKIDPIRPEYHRVIIYSESGKLNLQCISTGNQQSSRLLSTVTANGFLLLPSKLEYQKEKYDEETAKAILIGEICHKK